MLETFFQNPSQKVVAKYKPQVDIPPSFQKEINDPVGPGQFVIDRYVASCDSQNQNRGAGIPALENVIDYVFNKLGVFDVFEAFKGDKKIDYLQFVETNTQTPGTFCHSHIPACSEIQSHIVSAMVSRILVLGL